MTSQEGMSLWSYSIGTVTWSHYLNIPNSHSKYFLGNHLQQATISFTEKTRHAISVSQEKQWCT